MNETRDEEDTEIPAPPGPRDDAGLYVGAVASSATTALRRLALAILAVCALMLAWAPPAAHARTVNWTGQGTDDNWTTAANWAGSVAPAAGDDLTFPNFSFRKNTINNFPVGTVWHSITFTGSNFEVSGNPIVVQQKIATIDTNGGTNRIAQQVGSTNGMTLDVRSGTTLNLPGGVNMNDPAIPTVTHVVVVQSDGDVSLGPLVAASTVSELHIGGEGIVRLLTDNPNFNTPIVVASGHLLVFSPGALGTPTAGTTVSSGGSLIFRFDNGPAQSTIAEPLTISGSGAQQVAGALIHTKNNLTLTGPVKLAAETNHIGVLENATLTITGPIGNAQGSHPTPALFKESDGTLVVASNATYTGGTKVQGGTLLVTGKLPTTPVVLENLSKLAGTGTVGPIQTSSATLAPGGLAPNTLGTLTASSLDLFNLTTYAFEAAGAQANSQDRLVSNGSVSLGNATLAPTINFTVPLGTVLTLVQKNSAGPVTGTFKNLPEGASVTANGQTFKISYVGGDGNDVTLTRGGGSAQCTARPKVIVQTAKDGPGRLKVTITAGTQGFPDNRLAALHFHLGQNSLVDFNGQVGLTGDVRIPLANQPTSTTFVVRRVTAGQATTLPFTAEDGCSSWKSFVGGGPNAF